MHFSLSHSCCVCTHSGIITSCLSWLEMVSLIPLHHMSGFICVLCQELIEFLHGSLWKSLKTPDPMWCVYSRQHYCFWLICLLYRCFCFSFILSYFLKFECIFGCQLFVCMFQELPLHITASIKRHRRFPFDTLFFHMKWNGKEIISYYVLYACCKQCLLSFFSTLHQTQTLLYVAGSHVLVQEISWNIILLN